MTTWKTRRADVDVRLDVTAEGARLMLGDQTFDYTLDAFQERDVVARIVEQLGVRHAAEALAVAAEPELAMRANATYTERRPRHPRIFGGGRGGTWVAWILGRTVRLSAKALDEHVDLDFDEVLAAGLPEAFVREVGEERSAAIVQAARELEPLECLCGTGAETIEQHGGLRALSHARAPRSMVEHTAACACCEVCGRWWSFEARGDSHYSYSYRVDLFVPNPVSSGKGRVSE